MTNCPVKLLCFLPASARTSTRSWIVANIDPQGAKWFETGLSPSGNAPATHYAANYHTTQAELDKWLTEFKAKVPGQPPYNPGWDDEQKQAWFNTLVIELRKQGVWLQLAWNEDGEDPDVAAELARSGLKFLTGAVAATQEGRRAKRR